MDATPAGWYDDPELPGQKRWWDGSTWSDDRIPAEDTPPPPPAAPTPPPLTAPPEGAAVTGPPPPPTAAPSAFGGPVPPPPGAPAPSPSEGSRKALWIVLAIAGVLVAMVVAGILLVTFLGGDSATGALEKIAPAQISDYYSNQGLEIVVTDAECEPVERKDGLYDTTCVLTIDGSSRTLSGTASGYISDDTLYLQDWSTPNNLVTRELLISAAQEVIDANEPGFEVSDCALADTIWVLQDGDTFDCTLDSGQTVVFVASDNRITIDSVS